MKIKIGIIQMAFGQNMNENSKKLISYTESAALKGAQIIVLPELHQAHYFCKNQDAKYFASAYEVAKHPQILLLQEIAKKYQIVIPCSFFEKDGPHFYNSLAMIDADGSILGVYRKSHIPDGEGYQEKFYFRPGNTGFQVFNTKYAKIGAGICWDQWFCEPARIMALKGAELLLYPTAIGSEPNNPQLCTTEPWVRVMKGHAVCNMIPVLAANRVGSEDGQNFYGNSFACDEFGEELARMNEHEEGVKLVEIDLGKAQNNQASFGFFRDRRIELYADLIK